MNPIVKYFTGERLESFLFLGLGILGFAIAIFFYFILKTSFLKGVAIPFLLVSFLEIVVGVTLIYRSPKDIIRVETYLSEKNEMIQKQEIPRMESVMSNFVIFRYTEFTLIIVGIVLMYGFRQNLLLNGIGLGLFFQSSVVLLLDFFAERRGEVYLAYLRSIIEN
jgi:predicted nucleic acid-binding Zn ribbon protein